MREGEVDAAGMNVQRFAEIFHGHCRTFDVPTGTARADLRFPEMFAGLWRLPESKVARAFFFVTVVVDPRTGLNTGQIDFGKLSVSGKFRDAVVDRTFAVVSERFLLQALDELHHFRNVVGSANPVFGRLNAKRRAIVDKGSHEFFLVLANTYFSGRGVGDISYNNVSDV